MKRTLLTLSVLLDEGMSSSFKKEQTRRMCRSNQYPTANNYETIIHRNTMQIQTSKSSSFEDEVIDSDDPFSPITPVHNNTTIDSIGDTVTIITEGTGTKEYKCLRKAFVLFLISYKLNIIQEATSIIHHFFHMYPTIVGYFFLATKIKRLVFSYLESEYFHVDSKCHGPTENHIHEREFEVSKDSSLDNSSVGTSTSKYTLHAERRRHILRDHEFQLRKRMRKLQFHDFNCTRNSSQTSKGEICGSCDQINRGSIEACGQHTVSDNKKLVMSNFFQKQDKISTNTHTIEGDNSWGFFVDCKTTDEDDRIPPEINFVELNQSVSSDYGQFIDFDDEDTKDASRCRER
jgi:hypothetical protein